MEWLRKESPDILCVQETKAHPDQLGESLLNPPRYKTYWSSAQKKGYSGVATFTKEAPLDVRHGFGVKRFDQEGRILLTEFPKFVLLNIYFPNGKQGDERLHYKLDFYDETLRFVEGLKREGKKVITCGDYNTAHRPIDLARPRENERVSGFLPSERAWLDKWIQRGQVDVFREFCRDPGYYTWWDLKSRARERNVGWRIDYHFVTQDLASSVRDAKILKDVMGSDHCPISLELQL